MTTQASLWGNDHYRGETAKSNEDDEENAENCQHPADFHLERRLEAQRDGIGFEWKIDPNEPDGVLPDWQRARRPIRIEGLLED